MEEIMKLLQGLGEDDVKNIMEMASKAGSPDDLMKLAQDSGLELAKEHAEEIFSKIGGEDAISGLLGNVLGGLKL